jgi:hypothetical protein
MFTNEEADEVEINKDPLAGLDMAYGESNYLRFLFYRSSMFHV